MRLAPLALCITSAGLAASPIAAQAANAAFQNFFTSVCAAPAGVLATRCAETLGGTGNLSGDSESSLNPTHALAHTNTVVSAAQTRGRSVREQADRDRTGVADPQATGPKLELGPLSLLLHVRGTWFELDYDYVSEAERGFEGDARAVELGLDYRLSDRTTLGLLAGVERTEYDFGAESPGVNFTPAANAGRTESDAWYLTAFGAFAAGERGYVELAAGYERNDGSYRRTAVFQESRRQVAQTAVVAEGDADGAAWWIAASGGIDLAYGAWSVSPYAGLQYSSARRGAYTERDLSNSGLAMRFSRTERKSTLAHAGVRVSRAFGLRSGVLQPQLRVEYQREFDTDGDSLVGTFVLDPQATAYALRGGERDAGIVNAGFGVSAVLANGWLPFLDYTVLLASDRLERQRVTLGLRREF